MQTLNEKLAKITKEMQDQAKLAAHKLGEHVDDLTAQLTEVAAGVARNGAAGARGEANVQEALKTLATKVGREKFEERMTETKTMIEESQAAMEVKMLETQSAYEARITQTQQAVE